MDETGTGQQVAQLHERLMMMMMMMTILVLSMTERYNIYCYITIGYWFRSQSAIIRLIFTKTKINAVK